MIIIFLHSQRKGCFSQNPDIEYWWTENVEKNVVVSLLCLVHHVYERLILLLIIFLLMAIDLGIANSLIAIHSYQLTG